MAAVIPRRRPTQPIPITVAAIIATIKAVTIPVATIPVQTPQQRPRYRPPATQIIPITQTQVVQIQQQQQQPPLAKLRSWNV